MKSFAIICQSCAARLKVAKPTLIGKILACPKCGTMIEIQPPEGWQTIDEPQPPSSPDSVPGPLESHFDDIDTVLQSTETQSPVASRKTKKKSEKKSRATKTSRVSTHPDPTPSNKPLPTPDVRSLTDRPRPLDNSSTQSAAASPVLPTDQWLNPAAQNRKKWLMLIAGLGGTAVLIVVGIVAFISRSNLPQPTAANIEPALHVEAESVEQTPDITDEIPPPILSDSAIDTTNEVGEIETGDVNSETVAQMNLPETELTAPLANSSPHDNIDQPTPLPISTNPPLVLPGSTEPPPVIERATIDSTDSNLRTNVPPETQPDGFTKNVSPSGSPLTNLDSLQSQMGELSALLESSGTSLLQIQDLASSEREEQLIGIPKYFVEHPELEKFDLERQMHLPCSQIRYLNAKLTTVVNDTISIIGIPLTIDTESILAINQSANPTIDVDIQGVDFNAAIDQIIEPLGLVKTPASHAGFLLQLPTSGNDVEIIHNLPKFPQAAPAERELAAQELISVIQGLIAPESWVADDRPATIALNGNQLVVKTSVLANHQISIFLKKISASLDLLNDPADSTARQTLITKWNLIADQLKQPTGLSHSPDVLLSDFLEQLRVNTGISVLVDWNNLHLQGWTPLTKIPGQIDEETLGAALSQLARSMRLTLRAVDATTLELTTFESAAQHVDLEVYHFGKMLAGKLNEEQALRLITETLGPQLQSLQVRFVYQPQHKTFVVLGPQSLQKQIAAVVLQLENL